MTAAAREVLLPEFERLVSRLVLAQVHKIPLLFELVGGGRVSVRGVLEVDLTRVTRHRRQVANAGSAARAHRPHPPEAIASSGSVPDGEDADA